MEAHVLRDRYELLETLGGGNTSTTYLALDRQLDRRCVVKELSVRAVVRGRPGSHSFDTDDFTKLIELFEREARVLAHLDHMGVPGFIDHFTVEGEDDTRLYTVQEHVEGETLEALVASGRHFTEDETVDVCRQLAHILDYLHGHSPPLIHRDIKPSNVILDADGAAHLVDFGSVRNALTGGELDGKTIVGTYGYMPIEQYEARALPQSDIYALGMTLVYVLSHHEPTKIPRSGMSLRFQDYVNVSDGFALVLERMIEPAPEDRYGSATALLEALDRIGVPAGAPASSGARARRWAAVSAGSVLAISTLFATTWLTAVPEADPDPLVVVAQPPAPEPEPGQPPTPLPPIESVQARGGVLSIDIYQDFRYRASGWPMGRSVSQSALPTLSEEPLERLSVPREWRDAAEVHFGYFPLGNGDDRRISFALVREGNGWALHVDTNNDEDFGNDGPPSFNEGNGKLLAASLTVDVDVVTSTGARTTRPYQLWTWFDAENPQGEIRGRFYAANHYEGVVEVSDRRYRAIAFEYRDHDALYRASGLCIDLDGDAECQEDGELFHDGDVVPFPGGSVRLELRYP